MSTHQAETVVRQHQDQQESTCPYLLSAAAPAADVDASSSSRLCWKSSLFSLIKCFCISDICAMIFSLRRRAISAFLLRSALSLSRTCGEQSHQSTTGHVSVRDAAEGPTSSAPCPWLTEMVDVAVVRSLVVLILATICTHKQHKPQGSSRTVAMVISIHLRGRTAASAVLQPPTV